MAHLLAREDAGLVCVRLFSPFFLPNLTKCTHISPTLHINFTYSSDYQSQYPRAQAELASWISEGKIKSRFTIVEGLEHAYESLNVLFKGENIGKT